MSYMDGTKEQLAIHGGTKTKQTPFGTGQRFGQEELKELTEVLEQGSLFKASCMQSMREVKITSI